MKSEFFTILLTVSCFTLLLAGCSSQEKTINESPEITNAPANIETTPERKTYSNPPNILIDKNYTYVAKLITSEGDIEIELNSQKTPITVNNFVFLAQENFYDNTVFHRTIKGFMIQGGDPQGNGSGGPGYKFKDEPITNDYLRGTIAMANSGANTNGSQFFIMHQDYQLPKNYVIFGQVISGIEIVDKIVTAPVTLNPMGEMSKPINPVILEKIEIFNK